MSDNDNNEAVLEGFLTRIKASLPDYVKDNPDNLADVIAEVKERVLDKAEDLAGGSQPAVAELQAAINAMGDPVKVARSFKRRGTPKVFISQELWTHYKQFLLVIAIAIMAGNSIGLVVTLLSGDDPFLAILTMASGIQVGLMGAFTALTLIFFWLSMEGYVPGDFQDKTPRAVKTVVKEPFSRRSHLVEASIGMVIAVFLISMPATALIGTMNPDFVALVRMVGMIWLAGSLLVLAQGLVGTRHIDALTVLKLAGVAVSLASISIIALLAARPEIIPSIFLDDGVLVTALLPVEFHDWARIGSWIVAGIVILAAVIETVETFMLRRKVSRAAA